jgi:HAD superfamily hydrolase (TIGR01509 family)
MDGVLVDSEPEYRFIERELFKKVGITPTAQEIKDNSGKSALTVWNEFKAKYKFAEDPQTLVDIVFKRAKEYYGGKRLAVIKPSVALLKRCSDSGLKVAIATSSAGENAAIVVKNLGIEHNVGAIAAGGMVKHTKPAPDLFLLAAQLLKVKPEECVVIEDARIGVKAAKAAGMKAVGYKAPGSEQDLSQADMVVDSPDKISVDTLRALAL